MVDSAIWSGNAVGVNKWKDATLRRIKGGKKIPQLYLTKDYREFKESLCETFKKLENFPSYVDLDIIIFMKAIKDSDGPVKAIMDALTESNAIKDDKFIRHISIHRHYHQPGRKNPTPDTIQITLTSLTQEEEDNILNEMNNIYTHLEE